MIRRLLTLVLALLAFAAQAAIEINQAPQAELETVKGIGPAMSSRILEARKAGNFKDWADLQARVKGIGERNAAKFSAQGLTVAGNAFAGAAVPAKTGAAAGEKAAKAEKADKPSKTAAK